MYRVVPKKDATLQSITIFGLDFTFSICFDGSTTMFIYIYIAMYLYDMVVFS